MRNILSISLPKEEVKYIENQVKMRGFGSKSAYVQYLIQQQQEMISEDQILQYDQESLRAHRSGKTKKLRSLEDLL